MSYQVPGLPEAGEYPDYASRYVGLIANPDVIQVLKTQLPETLSFFQGLDEETAGTFQYAPGKWTFKEVLGHLIDCERIFSYRVLRVARGDKTPLPSFDQDGYMPSGAFNARSLAGLMDEFECVRKATIMLLEGLTAEAWTQRGTVSNRSVTARGMAFLAAGHEAYHHAILRERYLPGIKNK